MNRMLVIGIGSLIMKDDGIGARVAEAIQSRLQEHGIAVLTGETDVQYCLNEIRVNDFLVIIDAVKQGKGEGSVEIFPLQDAVKSHASLHSQHDFSLMDAVAMQYTDIQGFFIGIEAAEIGVGFELSNTLKERFDQISEKVINAIVELKEDAGRVICSQKVEQTWPVID